MFLLFLDNIFYSLNQIIVNTMSIVFQPSHKKSSSKNKLKFCRQTENIYLG